MNDIITKLRLYFFLPLYLFPKVKKFQLSDSVEIQIRIICISEDRQPGLAKQLALISISGIFPVLQPITLPKVLHPHYLRLSRNTSTKTDFWMWEGVAKTYGAGGRKNLWCRLYINCFLQILGSKCLASPQMHLFILSEKPQILPAIF